MGAAINMVRRTKRNDQSGMTLLEVMIVLAIIALVMGLAAPRLMENFGRAKSRTAELQMQNVKAALQLFYLDTGRYPSEAEGLNALLQAPAGIKNWSGPYLGGEAETLDPWSRPLIYRAPGQTSPFELQTLGRDGSQGGSSEDRDISL
jgi:general secretion pathway protein G